MEKTTGRPTARERMRGIEPLRDRTPAPVRVSPWSAALVLNALGDQRKQGHRPAEIARAYHDAATKVPGFPEDLAGMIGLAQVLKEWYHLVAADVRAAGAEVP